MGEQSSTMEEMVMDLSFWQGKRVFLTGHTGFKGSWMSRILTNAGAELTGYSLDAPTEPNLFSLIEVGHRMNSVLGDIRDRETLMNAFRAARPEIVIHMAAQPIVRDSYRNPAYTYETNVMGTVNILECVRLSDITKSFLNVTTDKVYYNSEWCWGYREIDPLDGLDPYSNSKSCSELITHSYRDSFFADRGPAVSTARAGNVIGGGDFANDRIIPDCVRAAAAQQPILVRNPHSIRPYQHVLEPLFSYLMIAQKQYETPDLAGYYNIGPDDDDCVTTGALVDLFCTAWGDGQKWEDHDASGPHEAKFLKLDCSKLKATFRWKSRWSVTDAIAKTVEWARVYLQNGDICGIMDKQIAEYMKIGDR